ncbi:MAG: hypothetical protein KF764_28070 [Labilithrix sp.]|nr:hypothetical protein [Labilithrix sp.]
MGARHLVRALVVTCAMLGASLAACSGKTLDLGTARGAQGGSEPDDEVDRSRADVDAPPPPSPLLRHLTVDDVPCAITSERVGGRQWPVWAFLIEGTCGALGGVRILAESSAQIPYPQACGIATTVDVSTGADGDGGFGGWYIAGFSQGSCTLSTGPSSTLPNTGLAFTANVVNPHDASRVRRISYRAESSP